MTSPVVDRLLSGAAEVVPPDEFRAKLESGRPLRVKLGLDPTAPAVTLGWAVVLRKLRHFQEAGHTAVLIVGDFTARVGDPSGKSETRPRLSAEVVRGYAERLLDQFWLILDRDATEVRYNSEWLESMDMEAVLKMTAAATVARMLERDDFARRYAEGRPISVMEFLYPLLQGMDSVAVQADVELGGTDQTFNLLMGRDLQREHGQAPQVVFTMPLLEGLDGVQKMSQSLGNYVGVTEPPEEMFGKLMSLPDTLIAKYLRLGTDLDPAEVDAVERELGEGSLHPNEAKRRMAREIVTVYHGAAAARAAEERFDLVHREGGVPEDVPESPVPASAVRDGRVWLPRLLAEVGLAGSNAEARRLIEQGGVRLDGERVGDPGLELAVDELRGLVLQVGTHRFLRLT
ncbi:MAG TPA: tyrosine--tRNA ligase [Actinomycetota bacterium]